MWVVQGRFEEDARTPYGKLIKYGKSYSVGRRPPADIVVESKFVSRMACHLKVEDLTPDQLQDMNARPRVTITFEASKTRPSFSITYSDLESPEQVNEYSVEAHKEVEIHDGCSFQLSTTIWLKLVWEPMNICIVKFKDSADLADSVKDLGVHVSKPKGWRTGYTHLCVPKVKPTQSLLSALMEGKPIISRSFVEEVSRLGRLLRDDEACLENKLELPNPAKYFPEVDNDELPEGDVIEAQMQPSSLRKTMFQGTTFVFFATQDSEATFSIYKAITELGGGLVYRHDPALERIQSKADAVKLLMPYQNQALSHLSKSGENGKKQAPDGGLLIVCSEGHEDEAWHKALVGAAGSLRIAMPEGFHSIVNAILTVDARSSLNFLPPEVEEDREESVEDTVAQVQPETRLQRTVPKTGEATVDNTRTLPPREASDISRQVTPQLDDASMPKRRALPTRRSARTRPTPEADPTNDRGESGDVVSKRPNDPSKPIDDTVSRTDEAHPPATARRPLKRRAGAARPNILDEIYGVDDSPSEKAQTAESDSLAPDNAHLEREMDCAPAPRPTGRLTRRTGAEKARARPSDIFNSLLGGAGEDHASVPGSLSGDRLPKSKKYRMALEEQDAMESFGSLRASGVLEQEAMDEDMGLQTQHSRLDTDQTNPGRGRAPESEDGVVESGSAFGHTRSGRKRRIENQATAMDDEPVEQAEESRRKRQRSQVLETLANGAEEELQRRREEEQPPILTDAGPDSRAEYRASGIIGRHSNRDGQGVGVGRGVEMDSEPQFLQALNTQKKGKNKMDAFDDEFNRLRIAKPQYLQGNGGVPASGVVVDQRVVDAADEDFQAFRRMAEEELRMDVRGNFIQVDFVPLVVKKNSQVDDRVDQRRWDGLPNFKKFKAKERPKRAPLVMELTQAADYGLGDAYWHEKSKNDIEPQDGTHAEVSTAEDRPTIEGRRAKASNINLDLSDDSDFEAGKPKRGRKTSNFDQTSRSSVAKRISGTVIIGSDQEDLRATTWQAESDDVGSADLELDDLDSDEDQFEDLVRPHGSKTWTRGSLIASKGSSAATGRRVRASGRVRGARVYDGGDDDDDTITASGANEAEGDMDGGASFLGNVSQVSSADGVDRGEGGEGARRGTKRSLADHRAKSSATRSTRSTLAVTTLAVGDGNDDDDDDDGTFGGLANRNGRSTGRTLNKRLRR
ncbi:hypothetical protein IE53DRAFT_411660 [Violaceomyces palustris]|uniref:Uncharacterized protein n=1 Tax=Violaceomyces palustris TaxID=1673888 RepID=A0ACD0NUE7_9BASI|nr:hypothetical protein IE53DRAFT_411660 [Violaceomyces palustris]